MKIRKTFAFEGAHVVRGCSTERCATSIHGHSYRVELVVATDRPDHGQMVVDFGLLKGAVRDCIEAFDHTLAYWKGDDTAYLEAMRTHSQRWIGLPVSPSAEQLSRVLFLMVEFALGRLERLNGEGSLRLEQVVLHETATGCALCDRDAAHDPAWTTIRLEEIDFSPQVLAEDGSGILTAMRGAARRSTAVER